MNNDKILIELIQNQNKFRIKNSNALISNNLKDKKISNHRQKFQLK
jgi:hypothetical protein